MGLIEDCRELSDADLARDLRFLAQRDCHGLAKLLAHLAEFDRRQLCVEGGGESLFAYCTRVLGYDEFDAFRRIRAARTIGKYPAVLPMIQEGKISLSAICVLHPYLTKENHKSWFTEVAGRSRRYIESLIAARHPQGARPDQTRRFAPYSAPLAPSAPPQAIEVGPASQLGPTIVPGGTSPTVARSSITFPAARPHEWQAMVPISIDRIRVGFDAGIVVMQLIDRARQILRHKFPEGRLEDVIKEALELLLDRKDPQRKLMLKTAGFVKDGSASATVDSRPRFLRARTEGRYIPARVKTAVWERDGGRCSWRDSDGLVCGSKDWIEYDHVTPFAKGGRSDSPRNVRLLCRRHNSKSARLQGLAELTAPAPLDGVEEVTAPAASS